MDLASELGSRPTSEKGRVMLYGKGMRNAAKILKTAHPPAGTAGDHGGSAHVGWSPKGDHRSSDALLPTHLRIASDSGECCT